MKKIFILLTTICLASTVFLGCAPKVEAPADPVVGGLEDPATMPEQTLTSIQLMGNVKEITNDNGLIIRIEGASPDSAYNDVSANINENSIVINADGTIGDATAIKVGDKLSVYVEPAMTRSIPPMANAQAVIMNLPTDNGTVPTFIMVEEVEKTDKGITLLNQNKDIYVTLTSATPVTDLQTGEVVSLDSIQKGSIIFAWYDIVAQSYPAQATALKAVLAK